MATSHRRTSPTGLQRWILCGAATLALLTAVAAAEAANPGPRPGSPPIGPSAPLGASGGAVSRPPELRAPTLSSAPRVETPRPAAPRVESPHVAAPHVEPARVAPARVEMPQVTTPHVGAAQVPTAHVATAQVGIPQIAASRVETTRPAASSPARTSPPPAAKVAIPSLDLPKAARPAGSVRTVSVSAAIDNMASKSEAGRIGGDRSASGPSFAERVANGDIRKVTTGAVATKINLDQQYRLSPQGDVARRMGLGKKPGPRPGTVIPGNSIFVPHPNYIYRGPIGPAYASNSFRYGWHLPYFCGDSCWYPQWSPWVEWCWHPVHPRWDPRPIVCRPVVCIEATPWNYSTLPTWTAMSVPSGTWVDVPRLRITPQQFDLQMLAVRFVNAGHPEQGLGPCYRVWFRNNSDRPITEPFDVFIVASMDGQVRPDSPQAGVRVTGADAGETVAVDIRLPLEVTRMVPAANVRFQVIVDANHEIADIDPANNGAAVRQADILPVDPAVFEINLSSAPSGGEVTLAGEGLGPEPGEVLIHLGGVEMEAQVLGWYDLGVRIALPKLPLAGPAQAEIIVVRGDGARGQSRAADHRPRHRHQGAAHAHRPDTDRPAASSSAAGRARPVKRETPNTKLQIPNESQIRRTKEGKRPAGGFRYLDLDLPIRLGFGISCFVFPASGLILPPPAWWNRPCTSRRR